MANRSGTCGVNRRGSQIRWRSTGSGRVLCRAEIFLHGAGPDLFQQAEPQFILKDRADKWIAKYANTDSLTVRYNPDKAKDSVLLDTDNLEAQSAKA